MPGCIAPGDCDGDGARAIECDGDDCDDDDPNNYPGNVEVCDAEGHDEDCDPATVGATDADSDTYVSAACCNGEVCGTDCDDSNASVHPDVGETCNGVDDDCDGAVDISPAGLCPGGLCLAGACRIDSWERAFGGTSHDYTIDVAVDGAGNVVLATRVTGSVDFGSGPAPHSGLVLVGYGPDGTHRWDADLDPCAGLPTPHTPMAGLATDASGGIYVAACCRGGGDVTRTAVHAYASDGTAGWSYPAFAGCGDSIDIAASGDLLVGGYVLGTTDLGGGGWTSMREDGFVLQLSATGEYVSERRVEGANDARVTAVGAGAAGAIVIGLDVDSGFAITPEICFRIGATTLCEAEAHGALVSITSAGAVGWSRTIGNTVTALGVAPDGGVVAGGLFSGTLSVGGPDVTSVGTRDDGIVVGYDAGGTYRWKRHLSSPGSVSVNDIDVGSDSFVGVTGAFSDTIVLGGSPSGVGRADRDIYAVWYGGDGAHVRHVVLGADGNDDSLGIALGNFRDVAFGGVFLGTVDLGTGSYTSVGSGDAFVVRTTY